MATEVTSRPVESPVAPAQEYITDLPDGMTLESLTKPPPADQRPGHFLDPSFEEVPAEPEPEKPVVKAEPEPEKPAPVIAAEPEKPAHKPAPPGVLKEREKARHYKRQWEAAEAAKEEAQRREAIARATPPPVPQITLSATERAELRRQANEKDTPADVFDFTLDTVLGKVNAVLARPAPVKTPMQLRAEQKPLEERFTADLKARGIDYAKVIDKAGLWKALAVNPLTGRYEDPGVAAKVLGSSNWAETLFGLAWGKLEHEGFFDSEDAASVAISGTPASSEPEPAKLIQAPAVPAAKPAAAALATPTAEALAEAERRGAQRVAEEVGHTADRGRGIRSLPSAGGSPRAAFSRESLIDLMRRDYPAYQRLCARDPRLNAWVIEGIPLDEP